MVLVGMMTASSCAASNHQQLTANSNASHGSSGLVFECFWERRMPPAKSEAQKVCSLAREHPPWHHPPCRLRPCHCGARDLSKRVEKQGFTGWFR
eukprot:873559-Amphidinium_carterae.4